MALKTEIQHNAGFDWVKWLFAAVLLIVGLVLSYYYNYQPWPLRLLAWFFILAVIGAILLQTIQGKQVIIFVRESRMELRKVYWPTRQETMQTTLIVAVMVVLLALLLWGIDGVLMWFIGWLTGQRG